MEHIGTDLEMLTIRCVKCRNQFHVVGHTTPDSYEEPGEVVTDLECIDKLCDCLMDGAEFDVIDEDHETFDDDVI